MTEARRKWYVEVRDSNGRWTAVEARDTEDEAKRACEDLRKVGQEGDIRVASRDADDEGAAQDDTSQPVPDEDDEHDREVVSNRAGRGLFPDGKGEDAEVPPDAEEQRSGAE